MKAVTYDKESELANIHLLPPNKRWKIQSEELEVNDCILLDIGLDGKISGFECFGEPALLCAPYAGTSRIYVKDSIQAAITFVSVNMLQYVPAIQCTVSLFVFQMPAIRNLLDLILMKRCTTVRLCSA